MTAPSRSCGAQPGRAARTRVFDAGRRSLNVNAHEQVFDTQLEAGCLTWARLANRYAASCVDEHDAESLLASGRGEPMLASEAMPFPGR